MASAWVQGTIEWVKEHPIESMLIGIGAAATAGAAYVLLTDDEDHVFKKAPSVSFLETTGDHVDFLVSAVKEAGAEGVFDAEAVESMERRFQAHAKKTSSGEWVLDAAGFVKVCHEIGIRDEGIVQALFVQWDTDRSGTIEFSEFLHVLAFSCKESATKKLESAFSLMDKNKDGAVSYAEMASFFRTVYKAIGKPKTPSQIQSLVNQVFAKLDKDYSAEVERHEFSLAARSVHLSTGDTLVTLMDAMMDRFGTISSNQARRHRSGVKATVSGGAPLGTSKSVAPGASSSSDGSSRARVYIQPESRSETPKPTSSGGPPLQRQPTRD